MSSRKASEKLEPDRDHEQAFAGHPNSPRTSSGITSKGLSCMLNQKLTLQTSHCRSEHPVNDASSRPNPSGRVSTSASSGSIIQVSYGSSGLSAESSKVPDVTRQANFCQQQLPLQPPIGTPAFVQNQEAGDVSSSILQAELLDKTLEKHLQQSNLDLRPLSSIWGDKNSSSPPSPFGTLSQRPTRTPARHLVTSQQLTPLSSLGFSFFESSEGSTATHTDSSGFSCRHGQITPCSSRQYSPSPWSSGKIIRRSLFQGMAHKTPPPPPDVVNPIGESRNHPSLMADVVTPHNEHGREPEPTSQVPLVPQSTGFRPMDALLCTQSSPSRTHVAPNTPLFSDRYFGKHVGSNASADYLLPDQNCALWLTNLPPGVTYRDLLGSIRNFGRIWCTFINEPDNVTHSTAAAKVVFFTPMAATNLLLASWSTPLTIRNHRIKISHNRIKYPSKPLDHGVSRVLIITGHVDFVNPTSLFQFFQDRFIFQIDKVEQLVRSGDRAVVEYSFGSYRCQAQMGKMALEKDRPCGFEMVEFGEDPCEVGDTFSSYATAVARLQSTT